MSDTKSITLDVTEEQARVMHHGAKQARKAGSDEITYNLLLYPAMVIENLEASFPALGGE